MADLKNVVEHLQIIRTWAELDGKMGRGMEPKCCLRVAEWVDDALEMLKEQEPRVMTLEEVKTADVVFMEFQDVITTRIVDTWFGNGDGYIRLAGMDGIRYMEKDAYNDSWRCWTSRPTDEQRKATPWAT